MQQKEWNVPEEVFVSMGEDFEIMLGGKTYTVSNVTESIIKKRQY